MAASIQGAASSCSEWYTSGGGTGLCEVGATGVDVLAQVLGKINELLGLSAKPVSILWAVSWALAILPERAFTFAHGATLRAQIQPWAIVVAWACTFWLAVLLVWDGATRLSVKAHHRRALRTLSPVERELLHKFVINKGGSIYFRLDEGVAMGLVHKGVLFRPVESGTRPMVPFNVSQWAWDTLQENPNLVRPKSGSGS